MVMGPKENGDPGDPMADVHTTSVGGERFRIVSGRWPDVALRVDDMMRRGWRTVGGPAIRTPEREESADRTSYAMIAVENASLDRAVEPEPEPTAGAQLVARGLCLGMGESGSIHFEQGVKRVAAYVEESRAAQREREQWAAAAKLLARWLAESGRATPDADGWLRRALGAFAGERGL